MDIDLLWILEFLFGILLGQGLSYSGFNFANIHIDMQRADSGQCQMLENEVRKAA